MNRLAAIKAAHERYKKNHAEQAYDITPQVQDEVLTNLEKTFVIEDRRQVKKRALPYCDCSGKMAQVIAVNDNCGACGHSVLWAFDPPAWSRK